MIGACVSASQFFAQGQETGIGTGGAVLLFKDEKSNSRFLAFDPQGKAFAITSISEHGEREASYQLKVLRIPSPGEAVTLPNSVWALSAMFSSDGRRLAALYVDGTARLWELNTPHRSVAIDVDPESEQIWSPVFSSNNTHVFTGGIHRKPQQSGEASRIIVWDAKSGKRHRQFGSWTASFLPCEDSRRIVVEHCVLEKTETTGKDLLRFFSKKVVAVWDIEKGENLGTIGKEQVVIQDSKTGSAPSLTLDRLRRLSPFCRVRESACGALLVLPASAPAIKINAMRVKNGAILQLQAQHAEGKSLVFDQFKDGTLDYALSPDRRFLALSGQSVTGKKDTAVYVWDLRGWLKMQRRAEGEHKTLELWACLGSDDFEKGLAAWERLIEQPTKTTEFLKGALKPRMLDKAKIDKWTGDLESDSFEKRRIAQRELEKIGEAVSMDLESRLKQPISLESKQRILAMLARIKSETIKNTELVRQIWAVDVLERIGTKEAVEILVALSRGYSRAWLTKEAQESLRRLKTKTSQTAEY